MQRKGSTLYGLIGKTKKNLRTEYQHRTVLKQITDIGYFHQINKNTKNFMLVLTKITNKGSV